MDFEPQLYKLGFSLGRRLTLWSEILRIPNRPRTAVIVRLSLSDMIVMAFSGFHHFPQLLFLLGLPWAFGVSPAQDHCTTRSPTRAQTNQILIGHNATPRNQDSSLGVSR
jgi:hypothetical protein